MADTRSTCKVHRRNYWTAKIQHSDSIVPTSFEGIEGKYLDYDVILVIGVQKPKDTLNKTDYHKIVVWSKTRALTRGQVISFITDKIEGSTPYSVTPIKANTFDDERTDCLEEVEKEKPTKGDKVDTWIKNAMTKVVEEDGRVLTGTRLRDVIVAKHGNSFYVEHKKLIDTMMTIPLNSTRMMNRIVKPKYKKSENMRRYKEVLDTFTGTIAQAVMDGGLTTTHSAYTASDVTDADRVKAICMTAILPAIVARCELTDEIPALYFYGESKCGKSFLFNKIQQYKKIATDSEGVSKFKIQGDQSAYLVDDIRVGWLEKNTVSKTMRVICLGEEESIKVHGDTMEVRAFVVLSGNDTPEFLEEQDPSNMDQRMRDVRANMEAWKRRFVCLRFTKPLEHRYIRVEYGYTCLDCINKRFFMDLYESLESESMKQLFEIYYGHISTHVSVKESEEYQAVFGSDASAEETDALIKRRVDYDSDKSNGYDSEKPIA